ncbi:MAG: GAF domain-containing protein [Actinomycetota bacterium]
MPSSSPIEREAERLALLASVELSPESETRFNELVELAAFVTHTPMAALTIIDADSAWFKAALGFESGPVERTGVPCNATVAGGRPLVVPDLAEDPQPEITQLVDDLGLRFYAGFPLMVHDDLAVGTLCVLDRRPRRLLSDELHALRIIADQAATQLRVSRLEAMLRDHD